MSKSITTITICFSLALISTTTTCDAQLINAPKRLRNDNRSKIIIEEQNVNTENNSRRLRTREFGRRAFETERPGQILEIHHGNSMPMSMSFPMELSMSMPTEEEDPAVSTPAEPVTDTPVDSPETETETPSADEPNSSVTTRRVNLVGMFLLVPFLFVGFSKR